MLENTDRETQKGKDLMVPALFVTTLGRLLRMKTISYIRAVLDSQYRYTVKEFLLI